MSSMCQNIKTSYEHLTMLTVEFTNKYQEVKEGGDLREVKVLRKSLEAARDAFLKHFALFHIPQATDPYYEALKEQDTGPRKIQRYSEIRLDLRHEIRRQLAIYAEAKDLSGHSLLQEWVNDISENEGSIYAEVAKDHAKIENRIKKGMIPIVMPGRSVQERTWSTALACLRPLSMENGEKQWVGEAYIAVNTHMAESMTSSSFFKDIPDRPYLVWTLPTQMHDRGSYNKSFDDQQTYNNQLVAVHPDLYDQKDIIPTEYCALQAVFTQNVRERYLAMTGETTKQPNIAPLDRFSFTRFLSDRRLSNSKSLVAYYLSGSRRLYFETSSTLKASTGGFRPVARS